MSMFQKPLRLVLWFLFALSIIGVLVVLGLNTMSERGSGNMAVSPQGIFLRDRGILYVKSEYHQAQMGLSIVQGGGDFRPLTTTYEWWLDAQNPRRVRRVTTEWLEDGPHLVAARWGGWGESLVGSGLGAWYHADRLSSGANAVCPAKPGWLCWGFRGARTALHYCLATRGSGRSSANAAGALGKVALHS